MNTQLEKLFLEHKLSSKDRYDFHQIYMLLPDYKKIRVIESFDEINSQIKGLKQDLYEEQEILFGKTLKNIEEKLSGMNKKRILSGTKNDISRLREII